MMQDIQIKERPKCQCGKEAIVYFRQLIVCGDCCIKLIKKEHEQAQIWMEEINGN